MELIAKKKLKIRNKLLPNRLLTRQFLPLKNKFDIGVNGTEFI